MNTPPALRWAVMAVAASCSAEPSSPATSASEARSEYLVPADTRTVTLGAPLSSDHFEILAGVVHQGPAVTVTDVLAAPQAFVGKALRMVGAVVGVAPTLQAIDLGEGQAGVRVILPVPAAVLAQADMYGREIIAEGQLRLLAAGVDPGADPRLPELHLVATGVVLARR